MIRYLNKYMRADIAILIMFGKTIQQKLVPNLKIEDIGKDAMKNLKSAATFATKSIEAINSNLDDKQKGEIDKVMRDMSASDIYVRNKSFTRFDEEDIAPVHVDVIRDFAEDVIEVICKPCKRDDFTKCKIRTFFEDTLVEPCDCSAKGKCQFKEVGQ